MKSYSCLGSLLSLQLVLKNIKGGYATQSYTPEARSAMRVNENTWTGSGSGSIVLFLLLFLKFNVVVKEDNKRKEQ